MSLHRRVLSWCTITTTPLQYDSFEFINSWRKYEEVVNVPTFCTIGFGNSMNIFTPDFKSLGTLQSNVNCDCLKLSILLCFIRQRVRLFLTPCYMFKMVNVFVIEENIFDCLKSTNTVLSMQDSKYEFYKRVYNRKGYIRINIHSISTSIINVFVLQIMYWFFKIILHDIAYKRISTSIINR